MSQHPLGKVLRLVRGTIGARDAGDTSDAELVDRFATQREEGAFTALLLRHGPLVLGVCRRVLGNAEDADDAFQATFLVLIRKAGSIRKSASLASWLHGVAYRVSLEARTRAARRRVHEKRSEIVVQANPSDEAAARELRAVLDQELEQLPQKYRSPLVLHYLAGKTKEETAQQLGWTEGTVSGRLARARDLLRNRLSRRGVTLSAGMLATALARNKVAAAESAALVESTLKIAMLFAAGEVAASAGTSVTRITALAEGALRAMFLSTRKVATLVVLAIAAVGLGAGVLIFAAQAHRAADKTIRAETSTTPAGKPEGQPVVVEKKQRKPLLRVPMPARTMMTVALSANGKLLAIAPHDKTTVELWDVATGKQQTLRGHAFSVTALAFSPDGKTLATGTGSWLPDSAPGEIKLWDVATGKERSSLGRGDMIVALAFSPDGKTLASASKSVKLWDVPSGKEKSELKPNEGVWLTVTYGKVVHQLRGFCWSVAFSPDGKTLAAGVGVLEDNTPGAAILYDVGTGKLRTTLPGHKGAVACVAFTPDGKTLASADSRGTLKLWDVATAKERANVQNPNSSFFLQQWAFTADGNALLSTMMSASAEEGEFLIKEWEVASGRERATFWPPPGGGFLAVSGDGRTAALGIGQWGGKRGPHKSFMEVWDVQSLSTTPPKRPDTQPAK